MTALRTLFDLSGRVALVTGARAGSVCRSRKRSASSAPPVAAARKPDELERAQSHLAAQGVTVNIFASDLRTQMEAQALTDKVMAAYGRIDILIGNAGNSWGHPPKTTRRSSGGG